MSAFPSRGALMEGVKAISAEASGVMKLAIVTPAGAVAFLAAALGGDADAARVFRAITRAQRDIKKAERRTPMLCASCPRALRKNAYTFCVTLPCCDDPSQALAMAVCNRCGTEAEVVETTAMSALRRIWPDARPFTITHPAGGSA